MLARLSYATDGLNVPLCALCGNIKQEHWLATAPLTLGELEGVTYAASDQVCFASLDLSDDNLGVAQAAELAYQRLAALGRMLGFPEILRIWHYLADLNQGEGDQERYKQFCLGRARAMERENIGHDQLPAATLVGNHAPGLRMHCLLVRTAPEALENPRQVSAYHYPREYGPRQPAFARAVVMPWANSPPQLFISGTASIVGHESLHPGDLIAQLEESMRNISVLLDSAADHMGALTYSDLDYLKVYIRKADDAPLAYRHLRRQVGTDVPVVFLHADLCRRELLVEIETQVTLTRQQIFNSNTQPH